MAENNLPQEPLKRLERIGKEFVTGFLNNLVQNNVLKLEEEEKEKFDNAKHEDKARVFIDSVRQKRVKAGQMFLQTFLNMDEKTDNIQVHPETEAQPPEAEESVDTLKLCPPEKFISLCRERAEKIYPIKDKNDRTRLALIICNTEFDHLSLRYGADRDIIGMKGLLEDLDYTVMVEERLTAKDMERVMKEFAARSEHMTSDSTFLVLMSHGTLHGICGTLHSDENPDLLPYDTIYRIFNNRNCRSLRDKPKVLIVQACRGVNPGEVWVRDPPEAMADSPSPLSQKVGSDGLHLSHVEKDFIAFYSTTPHNKSYRDYENGSFFITELITCFQKYSWSCHLLEIFWEVQRSFEKPNMESQMPTIERLTLTKHFYLFPGN